MRKNELEVSERLADAVYFGNGMFCDVTDHLDEGDFTGFGGLKGL